MGRQSVLVVFLPTSLLPSLVVQGCLARIKTMWLLAGAFQPGMHVHNSNFRISSVYNTIYNCHYSQRDDYVVVLCQDRNIVSG